MSETPTLPRDALAVALADRGLPAATVDALHRTLAPHAGTLERAPGATIRPVTRPGRPSALRELVDRTAAPLVFEGELGRGGMGVVRLATQTTVGRKVAVKTLRPAVSGDGPAVSLLQEAWVTGALEHPNIVPVYDVGVDEDGRPLVVLKRIAGTAWRDLFDDPAAVRARFGVEDALEWHLRTLMQVATAVHSAHRRGVIHRDIKPDNVMVGDMGEVYVVDWGIALALEGAEDDRLPRATEAEGLAGTPAYMAPEMFEGEGRRLGPHTDVYLLGATLYHLLAGCPPHRGASALAMMLAALDGPPPAPEADPALWAVCQRAMAREPADRFASADAFRLALQSYLDHRHAARLADEARQSLDALALGLAAGALSPTRRHRLFGECRFGFTRALASAPGIEHAREGLVRATRLMVEQALAEGQADAAAALLAELAEPPADLVAAVEAARAAADAERQRLERLERLKANLDPRTGSRARSRLFAWLGLFWMLPPLYRLLSGEAQTSYAQAVLEPAITLVLAGVVMFALRRELSSTVLNRRIVGMIIAAFILQIGMNIGAWQAGLPLALKPVLGQHFAAAMMAVVAITMDLRLLWSAALWLAGYLVGTTWPALIDAALVVSAAGFALNAWWVWVWRPRGRRRADAQGGGAGP